MNDHRRVRRALAAAVGALTLSAAPFAAAAIRSSDAPAGSAPAVVDAALAAELAGGGATQDLLVFVHGTSLQAADDAVARAGLTRVSSWDRIGVVVAGGTSAQVRAVTREPGVTFVERDRDLSYSMETSHQATRYDEVLATDYTVKRTPPEPPRGKPAEGTVRLPARPASGRTEVLPPLDGSGVSIAIVDSGIDATHPLFNRDGQSKVVVNKKLIPFSCLVGLNTDAPGPCTSSPENGNSLEDYDTLWVDADDTDTPSNGGHGTHVAGIAAAYPSDTRELHGSAPGAKLVGLSVGQVISVFGGNEGLNWVLENHAAPCGPDVPVSVCPPIKVVNNSYGPPGGGEFDAAGATAKLQRALVEAGIVTVWANGNDGGDGSANVSNPAGQDPTPGVISVANYDDADSGTRDGELAASSSRGKRGEPNTYPDVAAPGSAITSACRITLPICTSGDTDPNYGTIGGTSMAAPHVAGYTAVLQQASMAANGSWLTPGEIEDLLEDTAYKFVAGAAYEPDLPDRNGDDTTSFDKGHGLVDMKRAVAQLLGTPIDEADPVQPVEATCVVGGPVARDPEGDAVDAQVRGAGINEPALDLRSGSVTDAGDDLVFTIAVTDLAEDNPETAPQVSYNSYFTYDGLEYYVDAGRNAIGDTAFGFGIAATVDGVVTAASVRAPIEIITGSFDATADTITMVLPKASLSEASGTLVAPGATLDGFLLNSRRAYTTTPITQGASADDAAGSCPFVVPGEVAPPPAPEPTEPYVPPASEATIVKGQTLAIEGGPVTAADVAETCGVTGIGCDVRGFRLEPGDTSVLTVQITGDLGAADLDLYVLDPDGIEVGNSASTGSAESVTANVTKTGTYTVRIVYFASVQGSYSGSIGLA